MNKLQKTIDTQDAQFVEKGADLEHDRWARWQKHMFSKMTEQEIFDNGKHFKTGNYVLHKDLVDRWFRQIDTPYSELSEEEKESDRKETRNYLPLIQSSRTALIEEIIEMGEKNKREVGYSNHTPNCVRGTCKYDHAYCGLDEADLDYNEAIDTLLAPLKEVIDKEHE